MRLLMVGGTGRSGTSFVYKRVLQCSGVQGFDEFESGIFTSNISLVDVFDRYIYTYSPDRFSYVCSVFSMFVIENFGDSAEEAVKEFIKGLYTDRSGRVPLHVCFQTRARDLVGRLFGFDEGKNKIVIEKTPHNILLFDRVRQMFPEARIIHVVRDPRAVAESVVRQTWGPNEYRKAIYWVRAILETWIRYYTIHGFQGGVCLRAEDMTINPERAENLVRELVGERLEELQLKADSAALDGWRDNISNDDFEFANAKLREIMEFFGYDREKTESRDHANGKVWQLS